MTANGFGSGSVVVTDVTRAPDPAYGYHQRTDFLLVRWMGYRPQLTEALRGIRGHAFWSPEDGGWLFEPALADEVAEAIRGLGMWWHVVWLSHHQPTPTNTQRWLMDIADETRQQRVAALETETR